MFRQPLLQCACLIAGLSLAMPVAPGSAWGQDRSTQERLERLERDLNMLQRQVYRGAPPASPGGDRGAAVDVEIRMERLETQIRDLTGRVEEGINEVERVRRQVEQLGSDVDMRLGQAPGGPGPAIAAVPSPGPGSARPVPGTPPSSGPPGAARPRFPEPPRPPDEFPPRPQIAAGLTPPGVAEPPPADLSEDAPTPIFGTLTPPGTPPGVPPGMPRGTPPGAPPARELASAAPAGHPPAGGTLPSGSATEQYNHAFGLLKEANYPAAEAALKAFVEQHPKDPMAGNAQYWLGETYYTRAQYLEAASAFAEGYKRYPKSAKAPDNLLKLGMSLARANQKQNACIALAQLDHDFPRPGAAISDRAAAEKKRLGC